MPSNSGHQGNIKDPEHDGRLKENREAGRTKGTTPGSRERQEKGGHSGAEEGRQSAGNQSRGGQEGRGESHGSQEKSGENRGASQAESGGGDDLREREYKDEQGNVHHHTRAYMEQHKGE